MQVCNILRNRYLYNICEQCYNFDVIFSLFLLPIRTGMNQFEKNKKWLVKIKKKKTVKSLQKYINVTNTNNPCINSCALS